MTDTPRAPDDEIVSAYLDGEASAFERALVEQDPAALARLEAFAAVQAEVAVPLAVPAGALDAALAAALAAFDDQAAGTSASTTDAPTIATPAMPTWITDATADGAAEPPGPPRREAGVVSLTDRRRPPAARRILSVAAAVLVLLGIGVVIRTAVQGSRDAKISQTAGGAPATTAAPQDAGGAPAEQQPEVSANGKASAGPLTTLAPPTTATRNAAASGPSAPASSSTGPNDAPRPPAGSPTPSTGQQGPAADAAAPPVVDLGAVASPAALRTAVASALARDAGAPPASDGDATASGADLGQLGVCDAGLRSQDAEITTARLRATAIYAGTPVFVLVYDVDQERFPAANGPLRLYTVETGSCRVLDVQTL